MDYGQKPIIPITKPLLSGPEAEAAAKAILSGWLTQGPRVAEFEAVFAAYVGAREAVACSSCTTALHMALVAAGVGPGHEVIVPSLSFIASANAVRYCGAQPVFADVDPLTLNLDPDAAEAEITPRTRAIMPVHQIGMPADLDRFRAIGRRHSVTIVEDAACAVGSEYRGRRIGGDAEFACFSFHPRKVITTGEGGMIVTQSDAAAARLRLLRQHGMSINDHARHQSARLIIEEYTELGFNYRMTDIQAAIGIEQMRRLDEILSRRRQLAENYTRRLRALPGIQTPCVPTWARPNYQSYCIRLASSFPLRRNELLACLLASGIQARRGIMTAHREPAYRDHGGGEVLTHSTAASDETLLLPLYPQMTAEEQNRVIEALCEAGGRVHAEAGAA